MPTYPAPIYSHQRATGTGPGRVIDIGTGDEAEGWFVLIVSIPPGTDAAVAIEGSHDGVNFARWEPSGGYASSVAKRLEFGVRFWRTNIISNTGTVTSSVGQAPKLGGGWHSANYMIVNTNATGQPWV